MTIATTVGITAALVAFVSLLVAHQNQNKQIHDLSRQLSEVLELSEINTSLVEDDNALFPALVEDKDPWNSNTSAWPKQMTSSQTTNQDAHEAAMAAAQAEEQQLQATLNTNAQHNHQMMQQMNALTSTVNALQS